jgi:hypothetical protein
MNILKQVTKNNPKILNNEAKYNLCALFYTSLIRLQYKHIASKNLVSKCLTVTHFRHSVSFILCRFYLLNFRS